MQRKSVSVNGVNIYPFSSFEDIIDYAKSKKGILVAINAEKILHATSQTREIINRNIGYCDGAGAVMALKKKGHNVVKLAGCELWLKIVERMYAEGNTFYLVGGKQNVIDATVEKLNRNYPGIQILNYRNGYLNTQEEREALLEDVTEKKPDVVFVAMGSPKQELLMEEMQARHSAIYQGLGGSFDVYTDTVKRAPKWWVDHNLEFAYRLIKEPSRIKRQLHLITFWFKVQLGLL